MPRLPAALRWGVYFAIALGLHVAGAAALIARWNDSTDLAAGAPVIMIDLAPVAVAPSDKPTELPPDQIGSKQQIDPDPTPEKPPEITKVEPEPEPQPEKPVEKVEVKPEPAPELAMLPPPKPPEIEKPVEKKKEITKKPRHRVASLASAPSAAERKAERAAAPLPGTASHDPNAIPNWHVRLIAQIMRHRRYPAEAEQRGDEGTVQVAFNVDRGGRVHNVRIARGSGSRVLDRDALAWLERSQPLPPPPPDVVGSSFSFNVPLRYTLR